MVSQPCHTGADRDKGVFLGEGVIGRRVEEVDSGSWGAGMRAVYEDKVEGEVGEVLAEAGWSLMLVSALLWYSGGIQVWDLKMAPLVPLPCRQRILMAIDGVEVEMRLSVRLSRLCTSCRSVRQIAPWSHRMEYRLHRRCLIGFLSIVAGPAEFSSKLSKSNNLCSYL